MDHRSIDSKNIQNIKKEKNIIHHKNSTNLFFPVSSPMKWIYLSDFGKCDPYENNHRNQKQSCVAPPPHLVTQVYNFPRAPGTTQPLIRAITLVDVPFLGTSVNSPLFRVLSTTELQILYHLTLITTILIIASIFSAFQTSKLYTQHETGLSHFVEDYIIYQLS